ncbi:MAG: phosphotransferase, partial [Myxococcota bacterium]
QAGQFRRALDQVPWVDRDPVPLSEAIPMRIAACRRQAAAVLGAQWRPGDASSSAWEREAARLFEGTTRLPCHRDYCPRNWLIVRSPEGGAVQLVVFDWGQARADAPVVDELKLWDEVWGDEPEVEQAWEEGYGRARTTLERRQREVLAALHALMTTVWAVEHGDRALERQGRRAMDRVRQADWM